MTARISMTTRRHIRSLLVALSLVAACEAALAGPIRVHGSAVVAKPVVAASPLFREQGLEVKITSDPTGGSSAGIDALATGGAEIALSTRPLTGLDRAEAPGKRLEEIPIGFQALALVVPRDVWEGGVRAITREQVRGIYEGRLTNWKQLGGEDRVIKFYNPAQGQGVWEFFVTWLYGEVRKAPLGEDFEAVNGAEETRNSVEFNAGSLSVMPPNWADGKRTFMLSLRDEKGGEIAPNLENIRARRYALARPLLLIAADRPAGDLKKLVDVMCGAEGQELVRKSDFVPAVDPPEE